MRRRERRRKKEREMLRRRWKERRKVIILILKFIIQTSRLGVQFCSTCINKSSYVTCSQNNKYFPLWTSSQGNVTQCNLQSTSSRQFPRKKGRSHLNVHILFLWIVKMKMFYKITCVLQKWSCSMHCSWLPVKSCLVWQGYNVLKPRKDKKRVLYKNSSKLNRTSFSWMFGSWSNFIGRPRNNQWCPAFFPYNSAPQCPLPERNCCATSRKKSKACNGYRQYWYTRMKRLVFCLDWYWWGFRKLTNLAGVQHVVSVWFFVWHDTGMYILLLCFQIQNFYRWVQIPAITLSCVKRSRFSMQQSGSPYGCARL